MKWKTFVVAISSSLNKTCLSLNLGVGFMRENVAGELDSDWIPIQKSHHAK